MNLCILEFEKKFTAVFSNFQVPFEYFFLSHAYRTLTGIRRKLIKS